MSNKPKKEKARQPYMDSAWFAGLMDEVRRTSKMAVADRLGVHRTTISCVCNGCGEYGNGHSSTQKIELAYRRAYEQLICPHTQAQVGIVHCRDIALRAAPTHNPIRMAQWQACQQCQYKPNEKRGATKVVVYAKNADSEPTQSTVGKADSFGAAHHEGWNCIGGPQDNPYPIEDQRHDYWDNGHNARRVADLKNRQRGKRTDEVVQQAGIIDKVTLPLPEVGGSQIYEGAPA
jgi:hypothetical protein